MVLYSNSKRVVVCTAEGRALCDGPSVVADQHRWTVYNSKVNLPAALNDPRLAKRESDFFTKTWGLDFTETDVMPSFYLPSISREHFSSYLQETAQVTAAAQLSTRCPLNPALLRLHKHIMITSFTSCLSKADIWMEKHTIKKVK